MTKIGIELIIKPNSGGSYQYWYTILNALSSLDSSKYKVYTIYNDDSWNEVVNHFNFVRLSYRNKSQNLFSKIVERMLWRFGTDFLQKSYTKITHDYKQIKREKLDVLFADSSLGMGNVLGIPTIIPIHDLMHRYEKDIEELKEGFEYREKLYRQEVRKAALILVDSELGKAQLVESYQDVEKNLDRKARVLPFIPPMYIFENGEGVKPKTELPQKYIFYPAQFWSHKNHIRLLEAVKLLKEKNIDIQLVLVGSEQNNSNTVADSIQKFELEKNVLILGYVSNDEMVYLYKNARALVMPTLFGPTNIPPLEAFCLGCPVATSRIYAIPEQLGDAALLFDPRNVTEIAQCIEKLWNDDSLCEELKKKGYKHTDSWGMLQFANQLAAIISEF